MFVEEAVKYFGKYCRLTNYYGETLEGGIVFVDRTGWITLSWGFSVKASDVAKIEEINILYN